MAVAHVDQGIADFYYWLLPRSIGAQKQMFPAHVTLARYSDTLDDALWGKYEGEQMEVQYWNRIRNDGIYYWLDAKCDRGMEIRRELGLQAYPPWRNSFHITIGNVKHLLT